MRHQRHHQHRHRPHHQRGHQRVIDPARHRVHPRPTLPPLPLLPLPHRQSFLSLLPWNIPSLDESPDDPTWSSDPEKTTKKKMKSITDCAVAENEHEEGGMDVAAWTAMGGVVAACWRRMTKVSLECHRHHRKNPGCRFRGRLHHYRRRRPEVLDGRGRRHPWRDAALALACT